MSNSIWGTFLTLALLLVPMIYLQRFLQREIQAIFLLITRQPDISMVLFSLLFLPGVLLHESSHYLTARLLGVRTGRFSIIPQRMDGGRLQLGFVETASTDFIRDSLIGAAPLISGGIFVALVGIYKLGFNAIWLNLIRGQLNEITLAMKSIRVQPDFWLWFYLVFTVSSTMMPSASDRKAWRPLILVMLGLLGIIILIGIGPWLLSTFGTAVIAAINTIAMVFGITTMIHIVFSPPLWLMRKVISRIVGYQVV